MCGLAGWFSSAPVTGADRNTLQRMVKTIKHRGPDGDGYKLFSNAALGHARLSIIDLKGGNQPMSTTDASNHIIFNGEIYNYQELRKKLAGMGCSLSTTSDTEVILLLYSIYGLGAFKYLRGMFAVVIWDEQKKRGVLARDQTGIKPLFYKYDNGEIIFASEAKAILARKNNNNSLDINSLHLLMNFRYIPGNRSLFEGISQLSPGEIIEWKPDGKINTHHFVYESPAAGSAALDILEESVRIHLTADVEVGCYLSGGIDSACVSLFAARNLNYKLKTFTLNIGDDPHEAQNAKQTADLFKMENYQEDISTDLHDNLSRLIWHLEAPKINAMQVNEIARLSSRYVKVALSGLGGDELFLGYNVHEIMYKANRYENIIPSGLRHVLSGLAKASARILPLPVWSEPERAINMFDQMGNWPRFYGLMRNIWDSPELRQKIYGPRMLDQLSGNAYDYLEEHWPDCDNPVLAMADFEWRNKMVNDLLWQEDRCSMAEGLEVRVPFLDPVLANHIGNMDIEQLMPGGEKKGYMRRILKNTLPEVVLNRPKSGFQVDARKFFNTNLAKIANQYMSREVIEKHGLFNPEFIDQIKNNKTVFNLRWHYFMLYLMLTTHIWLELFENATGSTGVNSSD